MQNNNTQNIIIVGVGGQGALLASRVLGNLAKSLGLDVKVSEVHGMSQRGGSVITHVRMGGKVYSPLVPLREADIILAFEPLEALRYLEYLKDGGRIIVGTKEVPPMSVLAGQAAYPTDIIKTLSEAADTIAFDADALAVSEGFPRAVNIALLGRMAAISDYPTDLWEGAIRASVPVKFTEGNLNVFRKARGE
ncbi:MAG: indolepyruvate oxidoreductase subunit beta [Oscillospiraceae bacterium]|jgi:indolepyruvate ferredoxin oxidoreductase beta subunit|nr:indolepyruvate oxidoreductase subunit beta [Oscillospiraceae bacterium]